MATVARSHPITIIGAGICGLTAALALAKRGHAVVLHERESDLLPIGAGIQISPNASRILIDLGLEEALTPLVSKPDTVRVLKGRSGSKLSDVRLGPRALKRYGAPYWVIHRGDLQKALLAAVSRVTRIEIQMGSDGNLALSNAKSIVLVCDGLHGSVSQTVLPDAPQPAPSGHRAWRTIIPRDQLPGELQANRVTAWLFPRAHVVTYPIRQGEDMNFVIILPDDRPGEGWATPGDPETIRSRLPSMAPVLATGLTEATEWRTWSLWRRAPLPVWSSDDRMVLGDAAHPTLPFLAQGAAMAIEDADCIARTVEEAGVTRGALRLCEMRRKPRTSALQQAAEKNGQIFHFAGPLAVARDLSLRALPGPVVEQRFDWIYNHRG